MFSNKWFSSLSVKNYCERKKEDTLVGYYMMHYTACHDTCLSNWLPNNQSRTTMPICKASLAVNHPEIALTLEKCLIQVKSLFAFLVVSAFM